MRSIGLVALVAALVAGCSWSGDSKPTTADRTAAPAPATERSASATSAAAGDLHGAHVRVLGLWSGPEYESFVAVKSAWERETGGIVDWEGARDLPDVLDAHLQAGDAPDIAVLPNLALMHQLARAGKLVPLDAALDLQQIHEDYAPAWIDLGSDGGKLYGIFYKVTAKSTVWYSPTAFAAAHYRVPKTWDEMLVLADEMVADGHAPFSIVAARGPGSGWPLTDWISELVLNGCGPDLYDRWIAGEVPWTDACIARSFARFARVVGTKGYVLGGARRILTTSDEDGADPLYTDPPTAYMYSLASFAQAFIAAKHPDLQPGDDYDVFPFPTVDPAHRGAVTIGADVPVLMRDTPAARSFMTYLASARAQEAWIERGGFTSVNRSVPPDAYLDPVARKVADELTNAEVSRFSAGDMMPAQLQRAWWRGMLELVEDPRTVDAVLGSLSRAAEDAG